MQASDRDILNAIDRSAIGYAIFDEAGRVLQASASARHLLGFSAEADLVGQLWYTLDHDTDDMIAARRTVYQDYLASREPWQGILRWIWPDGSVRYYDCTATSFSDDQIIIVINDRTDEIIARRTLEAREKLTSDILGHLPVAIMLQDRDGHILYLNEEMGRRYGVAPAHVIGKTPAMAGGLKDRQHIDPLFAEILSCGDAIKSRPVRINTGDLKGTHWLVNLFPLRDRQGRIDRVLTVEFDRTERVKLSDEKRLYQKKLYELQKVEALNRFAGGLAHELSNILHPAGVYARALKAQPDAPDREKLLERINNAVLQAGDILRQTLAMARDDAEEPAPVDLGSFLSELMGYAQDVAPSGLVYDLHAPAEPVIALADETELRQVLLNLLVNAADAQGRTGTIRITAGLGGLPPDEINIIPSSTGPFVWIDIIDEGSGIDPDDRQHIFEPFFTTKKKGAGTGLGLAVVQGMVTGWGGVVSVTSVPGEGSTFRVWIPESRLGLARAMTD